MRKIVFLFAAFAALTFASCGNKTTATTEGDSTMVDSVADTTVVDTTIVDTVSVDTVTK